MKPFLLGTKVYLRKIDESDLYGDYLDWFDDSEITYHMLKGAFPLSRLQQQNYFDHVINGSSNLVLAIVDVKDYVHIGNVGLHGIDPLHRFAEMGILIGNKDYWGKGLAAEAIRLICQHGFDQLNLNRIELGVLETHHNAIRLYERIGFQHEGIKRNHIYKHGSYSNVVMMAVLRGELV